MLVLKYTGTKSVYHLRACVEHGCYVTKWSLCGRVFPLDEYTVDLSSPELVGCRLCKACQRLLDTKMAALQFAADMVKAHELQQVAREFDAAQRERRGPTDEGWEDAGPDTPLREGDVPQC